MTRFVHWQRHHQVSRERAEEVRERRHQERRNSWRVLRRQRWETRLPYILCGFTPQPNYAPVATMWRSFTEYTTDSYVMNNSAQSAVICNDDLTIHIVSFL